MFNYGAIAAQIALHDEIEPIPDLLNTSDSNRVHHEVHKNEHYHHPKSSKNSTHHKFRKRLKKKT